jgi:hypothetical protein
LMRPAKGIGSKGSSKIHDRTLQRLMNTRRAKRFRLTFIACSQSFACCSQTLKAQKSCVKRPDCAEFCAQSADNQL